MMKSYNDRIKDCFYVFILVLFVAIISRIIYKFIPIIGINKIINEVIIALLLGLTINNLFSLPKLFIPGIKFSLKKFLRVGIILMGLRFSFQDVIGTGVTSLILMFFCFLFVVLITLIITKIKKIPERLAILIGVGTVICGNSAIIATAPVIEAKDDEVSFAIATNTLFGLLAAIFYPLIGIYFGLSDYDFGFWVGTSVNDTSQVIATSAAYSQIALDIATVVKMIRNTLMVPIIILIGVLYNLKMSRGGEIKKSRKTNIPVIPWFVIGFLMMSMFRTAGVAFGFLPKNTNLPFNLTTATFFLKIIDNISRFCVLMALSAVGLNTNIRELRKNGLRYLLFGLSISSLLAIFSLVILTLFL